MGTAEEVYSVVASGLMVSDLEENHYESLFDENPMKMCWKIHKPFFMAMKTAISDFMVLN